MDKTTRFDRNRQLACRLWSGLSSGAIQALKELTKTTTFLWLRETCCCLQDDGTSHTPDY
jgi:hypothetical protein